MDAETGLNGIISIEVANTTVDVYLECDVDDADMMKYQKAFAKEFDKSCNDLDEEVERVMDLVSVEGVCPSHYEIA
jgi:hypothetical protein